MIRCHGEDNVGRVAVVAATTRPTGTHHGQLETRMAGSGAPSILKASAATVPVLGNADLVVADSQGPELG